MSASHLHPEDAGDADDSSRRVGIPIHERALTDEFLAQSLTLVRPGAGRSIFVIEEPELGGSGRPDLVFITMSTSAFDSHRRSGLRLSSPAAARALDPSIGDEGLGVTRSYERSLRKELDDVGWGQADVSKIAGMVTDSLALEVKISDLKRALQQVARFRRGFHRSAILMPNRRFSDESHRSLAFYGSGLLVRNDGEFEWLREPNQGQPALYSRLWLLELVLRGIENGTTYRLSEVRNRLNARL